MAPRTRLFDWVHYTRMPLRPLSPPKPADRNAFLASEADRCVKCGLCQPECPTYALTRSEADSPRGRIALIEALAGARLDLTAALDGHLDGCLLCRRCESVCPSGVRFGALMDQARQLTLGRRPRWLRWTVDLLSRPAAVGAVLRLGRLAPALPGPAGRLVRLARSTAAHHPPAAGRYAALAPLQGKVGLFLGCVARHTHADTLHAALHLLRQAGFEVVIPAGQGCCGALHAHLGDDAQGKRHADALHHQFDLGLDAIVSAATGCGAHLGDDAARQALPAPHVDVLAFLAEHAPASWRWRALPGLAALHTPCSQLNVLRSAAAVPTLLGRIPALRLLPLPGNDRCCGAAGGYLLAHPETATRLRTPLVEAVVTARPDWVVTSNPGCALHLAAGLKAAGCAVPMLHPVELLARQLIHRDEARDAPVRTRSAPGA